MSASTQTTLSSAQLFEDHQTGRHASASGLCHHRRSVGALAQWSVEDSLQQEHEHGTGQRGGARSASHIIPVPSFDHKHSGDDGNHACNMEDGVEPCFPNRRDDYYQHRRQSSNLSPLMPLLTPHYPKTAMTVQYKEHSRSSSRRSTPRSPFHLTMSKITSEHDDKDPASFNTDQMLDAALDETVHIYTPQPLPISVATTPIWYTEYSSTTSTPAVSRRESLATSPQTFMLQGFLAQHSNGHIMHPRPANRSVDCSDCLLSDSDNNTSPESPDETEELDDRFFLLSQSPNPNEFEYGEFFMTETQQNARLHQADSPVFFNGFPLLRMTPMDR